jgi:hypothetical protein
LAAIFHTRNAEAHSAVLPLVVLLLLVVVALDFLGSVV